jgi:hypothetical protein
VPNENHKIKYKFYFTHTHTQNKTTLIVHSLFFGKHKREIEIVEQEKNLAKLKLLFKNKIWVGKKPRPRF